MIGGDLAHIDRDATVTTICIGSYFSKTKLPHYVHLGQPVTFFRREVVDEEAVLAAHPAATCEILTIGGERYVVRADNVFVPR